MNWPAVSDTLRKVLREEITAKDLTRNYKNNKLLAAAVQAVFLGSGFVCLDSGMSAYAALIELGFVDFDSISRMSGFYTLPQILTSTDLNAHKIALKFKSLSHFPTVQKKSKGVDRIVKVSGSCLNSGHKYRVFIDERKFGPAIEFFWGNSGMYVNDDLTNKLGELRESQVSEFWKLVKDEIAYPLMIGLCAKSGLPAPPCLMGLPTELRVKILESLPGANVAKAGCVCKELRDVANDNQLWKQKVAEEEISVSRGVEEDEEKMWKIEFARLWKLRKARHRRGKEVVVAVVPKKRLWDED